MKEKMLILCVLILFYNFASAQTRSMEGEVTIGIVVDGEWDLNEPVLRDLENKIQEALSQQAKIIIPENKILTGDWTLEKVTELNDRLLSDSEVDILIGYGVLASYDLARRTSLPKPVIAPVIIDTAMQKIKSINGTSGVKNLNYLLFPGTFERDIRLFKNIVNFKNLLIIQSRYYQTAFGRLQHPDLELSKELDIKINRIGMGNEIDEVMKSIPKNTDAVYIDVLPVNRVKFKELVAKLNQMKLPTFSMLGEMDVNDGVMAGANPDIFPRLARRIALTIQRILLGEDAGTLSIKFGAAERTFLNLQTAFSVGVSPKYSTMLEADIINMETAEYEGAQTYTLEDVIKKISTDNLDVLSKIREAAASFENISMARSNLLPRLDVSATGFKIDADRALAGSQPENKIYGDATFSQVLLSEPAYANVSIQGSLYESKLNELEAFKQNTILDGSRLFLNYLRTRKIFNILIENLKLLRVNLEVAKNRESIGAAGPEEPLRWEAEVAGVKKAVMDVQAQMNQAQLALKEMLNVPMIYLMNVKDVSFDDETQLISNKSFRRFLDDPQSYDLLTDFFVSYGLKKSADVQMMKGIIDAKERSLTSARLSRFIPTVSLFGSLSKTFYKSEIKSPFSINIPSPPSAISPEIPAYIGQIFSGFSIPLPDNLDWNVGIIFSLNLFNGMGTSAQIEQSGIELTQLKTRQKAIEDKIALGIRSEMENLKAKNFGLMQSKIQLDAAEKTLKIVSDSYSRGAVSILYLLDAQTSALNAQQISANSLYDLFISYMQLQRAIGQYDVFMSSEEKKLFIKEMINFISKTTEAY